MTEGPAGDSRIERSRRRVQEAAHELLAEVGVAGFSVEEVVRRSGVAKTTIYRHWASREALVLDVAARISGAEQTPDTGSVEADVTRFLRRLAELLETARWPSVVPSLVDVAERDEEFARVHGSVQRRHAAPLREVLERAVQRGDISADTDLSYAVSALVGPLYYRRWFSRELMSDQFVDAIARNVLAGLRPPRQPHTCS
jgi:AcrR family transcriptional regulator